MKTTGIANEARRSRRWFSLVNGAIGLATFVLVPGTYWSAGTCHGAPLWEAMGTGFFTLIASPLIWLQWMFTARMPIQLWPGAHTTLTVLLLCGVLVTVIAGLIPRRVWWLALIAGFLVLGTADYEGWRLSPSGIHMFCGPDAVP